MDRRLDMDNLKQRHYIFIDPTNIHDDINDNGVLNDIKSIHKKHYVNNEVLRYYSYTDIALLLKDFNEELFNLYKQLNYNYAALLADIGRYIILYNYGGIYHDLKYMSTKKMVDYLYTIPNDIQFIAEEHPVENYRVRNTNIVALKKNAYFFLNVLDKITIKLKNSHDAHGPNAMFEIGSGIYIEECKNQIKYPFFNTQMLIFDEYIYMKNIKRWQATFEPIFRKE